MLWKAVFWIWYGYCIQEHSVVMVTYTTTAGEQANILESNINWIQWATKKKNNQKRKKNEDLK